MEIPKSYVISPGPLTERREECVEHLRSVGIEPVVFWGLYGPQMRLGSRYNHPSRMYQHLKSATICLALNHWCLWSHIALMGEDFQAIIFEDDVLLPENFVEEFPRAFSEVPDDWDIFYLSILYPKCIKKGKMRVQRVSDSIIRHIAATQWDGACDGLHAYMLNGRGAKKMMDTPFTLNEPVDRWVSFNVLPFMNAYIWHPSPVTQKSLGKVKKKERWRSTSGGIKEKVK